MNMQVKSTVSNQPLATLGQTVKPAPKAAETASQASALAKDVVSVQSGVLPTLKGAAIGGLGTGAVAVGLFAATGGFKGEGAIIAVPLSIGAAIGGAFGGATSANVTASKWKGALAGAVGGAVGGAATFGLMNKSLSGAASGAIIGGVTGAVGGVFGAFVTKTN